MNLESKFSERKGREHSHAGTEADGGTQLRTDKEWFWIRKLPYLDFSTLTQNLKEDMIQMSPVSFPDQKEELSGCLEPQTFVNQKVLPSITD